MKDFPRQKPSNKIIIFLSVISVVFFSCGDSPEKMREDADKYFVQAVDYFERGYYNNARALFRDVIEIENELRLTDMTGDAYLYLGLIAFENSSYSSSLNNYKSAREIFKEKFDRKKEGLAENNIGSVYSSLGQYEEAIESYRRALGISQLSADKEGEGIAQINMGSLFAEQGNYQTAFNHFQKAFDAYNILGDVSGQLDASIRIGEAYLKFGSFSDALATFNYALERGEEYAQKDKIVRLMNNIGLTYFRLKNYQEALIAFEYGFKQIKVEEDPIYAWTLYNNIGDTYKKLFLYSEAIDQYKKAVELSDSYGEGLNSALIKIKIGELHLKLAADGTSTEYGKAAEIFEELLDLFEDIKYNYGKQQAFAGLAKVYSSKNDFERSFELISKAQEIFKAEIPIGRNRLTENFAEIPNIFSSSDFYSIFTKLNKDTELIEFSLNSNASDAIVFLNSLNEISLKDEAKENQLKNIRSLEKQIHFLSFEIANEEAKFNGYENSEKLENLEELLDEKTEVKTGSASILKDIYQLRSDVLINDIQKKLDNNTGFLSILSEDDNIIISLATNNKIINKTSQFSGDALNGQVVSLIKAIVKNDSVGASPLLRGIYIKTIKLIENELNSISNLIVYLAGDEDAQIHYLPVHALINEKENYFSEEKNIKYFGGFSGNNRTGMKNKSAVVSDTALIFSSIDRSLNIEKFLTSSSVKKEIITYDPANLFFYSPVYFNSDQPASSYFECFSDSASSPELNLKMGELPMFNLHNAAAFNFLTDKGNAVQTFNLLMPASGSIVINHFNISDADKLKFASEIINNFSRSNISTLESVYSSQGISWASLFQYVKL